jgi:hypothetical protein
VKSADWSQLPAIVIGSTIPATAGFLLARALATNSVKTLKRAELAELELHERQRFRISLAEREERRLAWDRLFDAVRPLDVPFTDGVVFALKARLEELSRAAAKGESADELLDGSNVSPSRVASRAAGIAADLVDWPRHLTGHVDDVVECLRVLVEDHDVDLMRVPLRATRQLSLLVAGEPTWGPTSEVELLTVAKERPAEADSYLNGGLEPRTRVLREISRTSQAALRGLSDVADRQRVSPHDREEVDTHVQASPSSRYVFRSRGEGRIEAASRPPLDIVGGFARLQDLLERLDETQKHGSA